MGPISEYVSNVRRAERLGKIWDLGSSWCGPVARLGCRPRGGGGGGSSDPPNVRGPYGGTLNLCVKKRKLSKRGGPPNSGALGNCPVCPVLSSALNVCHIRDSIRKTKLRHFATLLL